jgi:hypothetical protein
LIVTKAAGTEIGKFWTSIPEGRQEEADEVGELITEYLRDKKK